MSTAESTQAPATSYINMECVNRITKLPVIESAIQTATSLYGKVKVYNSLTQWTFSTAEKTVYKAVEITMPYAAPVVSHLEGQIQKVDDFFCNGLDYVEKKVPAVKLPPGELYEGVKDLINIAVGPALESAKTIYEPVIENAKTIVEPLILPVLDRACALKEYGAEKLDEYLHPRFKEYFECEECAAENCNNGETQSYYQ